MKDASNCAHDGLIVDDHRDGNTYCLPCGAFLYTTPDDDGD